MSDQALISPGFRVSALIHHREKLTNIKPSVLEQDFPTREAAQKHLSWLREQHGDRVVGCVTPTPPPKPKRGRKPR